jgi:hypothetical protein
LIKELPTRCSVLKVCKIDLFCIVFTDAQVFPEKKILPGGEEKKIGFYLQELIFKNYSLIPALSALENVELSM